MKGSEAVMLNFMEGADKRFIIPVYQRKYDWKIDNCRQLYSDLKKIVLEKRKNPFFGSIVSSVVANGSKIEYHIIDGQQRLTTITLLLLAIKNLISQEKVTSDTEKLDEQINHRFLISPWAPDEDKIKLHPVKSDYLSLTKLFGEEVDYEKNSNLTINYEFFYENLLNLKEEGIKISELYAAIGKLEIISITLSNEDDAQLIFESLNSTGLALKEGDKIRNYILMGVSSKEQSLFYDNYWLKIEKCTQNDVGAFIRDYLSIKQQLTPTINNVYQAFKGYAQSIKLSTEEILQNMLVYARFFEKLLTCKSEISEELDYCLYRLKRLEIAVTGPFFMELFYLHQNNQLTNDDILNVFLTTENYLFRRNICDVPTNALNKIFLNLNKEVLRYDNNSQNYLEKFKYILSSKKTSGRFPKNDEFKEAISNKPIYLMRGAYKSYLFDRLENSNTCEKNEIFKNLDNGKYSIEHIMPQTLSPAWIESLGNEANEIHELWLNRLANLTITGYNSKLSNKPFIEKRDCPEFGYKDSGLRINQKISTKSKWGREELEERNQELVESALQIWKYPYTNFIPNEKEFETCSLDEDNISGKKIFKFKYLNSEFPTTNWINMFEQVVTFLYQQDKSIFTKIAFSEKDDSDLSTYIRSNNSDLRVALKIDDDVFIEKNTSTVLKCTILRKIFALYDISPQDLVFYFK